MKGLWLGLLTLPLLGQPATFDKDIAPITFEYCAPCHHPGGSAPFSLLTCQDVRAHAAQMAVVTQRRYMPPWPPEHGYGDFVGERRLTDTQVRVIANLVKQGAPQGNPSQFPPSPHFPQ